MRRLMPLLLLASVVVVASIFLIGAMSQTILAPRGDSSLRTVILPTHTGFGVTTTDTFLGEPQVEVDCFTYVARDRSTILPIWPPAWYAKLGPRGFAGVWRPEDAADNVYSMISEFLEFPRRVGQHAVWGAAGAACD